MTVLASQITDSYILKSSFDGGVCKTFCCPSTKDKPSVFKLVKSKRNFPQPSWQLTRIIYTLYNFLVCLCFTKVIKEAAYN